MNKELRDKWTTALRSGRYMQGLNDLRAQWHEEKLYCCLGVLCDVVSPNDWSFEYISLDDDEFEETSIRTHRLSDDLDEHLSLTGRLEVGLTREEQDALIDLNDNQGKNFTQIADWIEENIAAA